MLLSDLGRRILSYQPALACTSSSQLWCESARIVAKIKQKQTCECLLRLLQVWMITGDKQETAINIGISCGLINDPQNLLVRPWPGGGYCVPVQVSLVPSPPHWSLRLCNSAVGTTVTLVMRLLCSVAGFTF